MSRPRRPAAGPPKLRPVEPSHVTLRPIGYVRTAYAERDATPTQAPYNAEEAAELVVLPDFVAGLRGLEGFDYAWLIAWFDRLAAEPPRIEEVPHPLSGTGRSYGVFATRSPARPNNLGLSRVRLLGIEGDRVRFAGVDLMDGTPVLDVKPFMSAVDIPPGGAAVRSGWVDELE